MKNITLSADDMLIHNARKQATNENTTLNSLFRQWLKQYTARQQATKRFDDLMAQISYVKLDHTYSREEMNQR